MATPCSDELSLAVDAARRVSAILIAPDDARACYVLAHGSRAGMHHPFMASIAELLAARGIATLRYQFPYMEQGSRRPDGPALAHATVRAAVAEAARQMPDRPLVAGGKSFGGRMTSQAQSERALPGVHGLVFLGFPLHPPGEPSDQRAAHLDDVHVPMLFMQGTRDELADLALLRPLVDRLGDRATLQTIDDGDHSFHVRGGARANAEVMDHIADDVVAWIDRVAGSSPSPARGRGPG